MPILNNLQQDFNRFLVYFNEATRNISQEYMQLPVAGFQNPVSIYRERVYCYELYHQLRIAMGDNFGFSISGEVDKRSHPLIRGRDLTNTKPDLLIHRSGDMGGNLVIIEVKPVKALRNDIQKDLRTLTAFRRHGQYFQAIYLIYGMDADEFNYVKQTAVNLLDEDNENRISLDLINLFWHHTAGEAARLVHWNTAQ
jgi:hypothetical protein